MRTKLPKITSLKLNNDKQKKEENGEKGNQV